MSEHWGDTISRLSTLPHALSEFVHWPQLCIPSWGSSIWERPTKGAQITQILNDWHTDVHLLWGLRTLILWPIEKLLGIWLHGHKLWRTTLGCLMSAKCQAVFGAGCEGETVRLLCFCAAHCQVLMPLLCSSSRSCSSGPLRKMSSTRRRTRMLPLLYRGSLKSKVCLQFLFHL